MGISRGQCLKAMPSAVHHGQSLAHGQQTLAVYMENGEEDNIGGRFCERVFVHKAGHHLAISNDTPALNSYALGAFVGKVWAPSAAQKGPKKRKPQ